MDYVIRRLVGVFMITSLIGIGAAHVIGSFSPEQAVVIGYHENESEIYTVYIWDLSRDIGWWLAGTRCYKPLPPWAYDSTYEERDTYDLGRSYARIATLGEVAKLLQCK